MEEHPHIIERGRLYIQPNYLYKDRDEYISRAAISVVTSSVARRFTFSPSFMAALLQCIHPYLFIENLVEYTGGLSQ